MFVATLLEPRNINAHKHSFKVDTTYQTNYNIETWYFCVIQSKHVKNCHSVVLILIQLIYLWNRTFRLILDKLSFTAMNFIRSENNQALLQLFMVLGHSEHML